MYQEPFARECPSCHVSRIPETKTVKEGRQKYVVYTCRICKHNDIERWADRPRPKIWDGIKFRDQDDDSFFEEDPNN